MNCLQVPTTTVGPADFERVAAQTLAMRNRLLRRRQGWRGQWGGQPLRIDWQPARKTADDWVDIGLRIGEADGRLQLSARLVQRLLEPLRLSGPFAALSAPAQALLLEWALLELIAPLEEHLGEAVRLVEPVALPASLSLHLDVGLGELSAEPAILELSPNLAEAVAALQDAHLAEAPHPLPAVRVPLAVQVGWQWLTLAELHSLRPGDVLMLERPQAADLLLELEGTRRARARRENGSLCVLETLVTFDPNKEQPMNRIDGEQTGSAGLDDLPIRVECRLGTLELSLVQLQSLGEGSVLELPGSETEAVELMVHGRRIGRGELVRIGAGLGVRLTQFTES